MGTLTDMRNAMDSRDSGRGWCFHVGLFSKALRVNPKDKLAKEGLDELKEMERK